MDSGIEFIFRGEFRYNARQIVDVDITEEGTAHVHLQVYTDKLYGTLGYSSFCPKRENDEYEFPGEWVGSSPDNRFRDLAELEVYISELPEWDVHRGIVSDAHGIWKVLFMSRHHP